MKKQTAIIERGKNGKYSVFTKDFSSFIYGEGATISEAKKDFLNTYNEIISFAKEDNIKLRDEMYDVEFLFSLNM